MRKETFSYPQWVGRILNMTDTTYVMRDSGVTTFHTSKGGPIYLIKQDNHYTISVANPHQGTFEILGKFAAIWSAHQETSGFECRVSFYIADETHRSTAVNADLDDSDEELEDLDGWDVEEIDGLPVPELDDDISGDQLSDKADYGNLK